MNKLPYSLQEVKERTKAWGMLNDLHPRTLSAKMEAALTVIGEFGCQSQAVRKLINILFDANLPDVGGNVTTQPGIVIVRLKSSKAENPDIPVLMHMDGQQDWILGKGWKSGVPSTYAKVNIRLATDEEIEAVMAEYSK